MDCLVTRLRENVENSNFPFFDEIHVRVQQYTSSLYNCFWVSAIEENFPITIWKDGNIVATISSTNPDGESINFDNTGIVVGDYLDLDNAKNIQTLANLSIEKEEIMKIVDTISVLYYFNINGADALMPIFCLMPNLTYISNMKSNGNDVFFSETDARTYANAVASQRDSGQCKIDNYTIKFGSSMVNPTEEETTQGWQIV